MNRRLSTVYMTEQYAIDQERMELGDDGFTERTFRRLREFIRRMNSSQARWNCFGTISKKLRLKRGSAPIDTYLWTFDQKCGSDSWWDGLAAFGTDCPYFTNVVHIMLMEQKFTHEFNAPLTTPPAPAKKLSFRVILFCFILSTFIVAAFLVYPSVVMRPQFSEIVKGDIGISDGVGVGDTVGDTVGDNSNRFLRAN